MNLRGIIPPMITPLSAPDALDIAGVERVLERMIAAGVAGVFILGTTGEGPGLSYRLRRELIDRVCKTVGVRVPVLVGISDSSAEETVAMGQYASGAGATALVLAPPFYAPISQNELLGYLKRLVPRLPLPTILYNMPSHTKVVISPETVSAAADLPNIVGLKDSGGDMIYFHKVKSVFADRPDFTLLVGPDQLLAESVLLGGHGGICGGANLAPQLYVSLYHAAVKGQLDEVRRLHNQVIRLATKLYAIGGNNFGVITGLKCALHQLGMCQDGVAEPTPRMTSEQRVAVRACLDEFEIK